VLASCVVTATADWYPCAVPRLSDKQNVLQEVTFHFCSPAERCSECHELEQLAIIATELAHESQDGVVQIVML
jgi:hypothetical protein